MTRLVWRRWEGRRSTGIDRVCLAYLNHFGRNAQAVIQHPRIRRILDREASSELFKLLADSRSDFRRALVFSVLRHAAGGGCDGRDRLYLNVGHTGLNHPGLRTWLARAKVRPVYFVHDLIPITHPQFCRPGEEEKHRERMRTVLAGTGVIANSRATLGDLAAFSREQGLPDLPSVVAPLGSDAFEISSTKQMQPPTFVILGTIEARKNHLMMLNVWARLVERFGSNAPRLLVVGQRGWECDDVFELLSQPQLFNGAVVEIDRCDDETLAGYLAGARALLFPSLVEGYGLPLVEALRSGLPVIASDLPVFREIAGEIPDYLDPVDASAWEDRILSYVADDSVPRTAQLNRLAAYHAPTWADHFEAVETWLSTV